MAILFTTKISTGIVMIISLFYQTKQPKELYVGPHNSVQRGKKKTNLTSMIVPTSSQTIIVKRNSASKTQTTAPKMAQELLTTRGVRLGQWLSPWLWFTSSCFSSCTPCTIYGQDTLKDSKALTTKIKFVKILWTTLAKIIRPKTKPNDWMNFDEKLFL